MCAARRAPLTCSRGVHELSIIQRLQALGISRRDAMHFSGPLLLF
jgi:hypothetical protein